MFQGAAVGFPQEVDHFKTPLSGGLGNFKNEYINHYIGSHPYDDGPFFTLAEELYESASHLLTSEAVSILFAYASCLHGYRAHAHCPNPCNALPCTKIKHAYPLSCLPKRLDSPPNGTEIKLHRDFPENFKQIFYLTYECTCEYGYRWDKELLTCKPENVCENRNEQICLNGGTCHYTRDDKERSFKCLFCRILI